MTTLSDMFSHRKSALEAVQDAQGAEVVHALVGQVLHCVHNNIFGA